MNEVVHDFAELADRAALAHDIAGRRVHRHHAIADSPAPLALGIEPDDAFDALTDEPQRPRLRIVVVVPRVAEHEDRGLPVERFQLGVREPTEREAEVGPAVIVDRRGLQRPLDAPLHRIRRKRLRDLRDLGDEDERAHATEALLKAPYELQHEARGVAHGVRDIADRDELGLLAMAALEKDLHRHAAVRQTPANRPPGVEPALLLLPLPQRERVLDLSREPRHDVLHLRDFLGRQREQRLLRQHLAGELLALTVRASLELALDVLADHAIERLQPELEIIPDPRELTGIEPLRLQHPHDLFDVALDRGPVEFVLDLAR